MRLYLDACCLNRPFDESTQSRVRAEAGAVVAIFRKVEDGEFTLLSSTALVLEISRTKDFKRRNRILELLTLASEDCPITAAERSRARTLRRSLGLCPLDALHLACAESMNADVFLTTDDRLLRGVLRAPSDMLSVTTANPLGWLTETLEKG